MSESTQSTDSKRTRPKLRTWVWHNVMCRPVYLIDVIEVMDQPVVAMPTFQMESDGKGVEEDSSRVVNMPTKWEDLSEIIVNPNELDF